MYVYVQFGFDWKALGESSTYIKAFPDLSNSDHYQMNLSPLTYGVIIGVWQKNDAKYCLCRWLFVFSFTLWIDCCQPWLWWKECSNGLKQQNFSNVIDGSVTISSKFDVLTKGPLLGKLVIQPMLFLVVQDSTFLCDCNTDTGECVVPKMTHTFQEKINDTLFWTSHSNLRHCLDNSSPPPLSGRQKFPLWVGYESFLEWHNLNVI